MLGAMHVRNKTIFSRVLFAATGYLLHGPAAVAPKPAVAAAAAARTKLRTGRPNHFPLRVGHKQKLFHLPALQPQTLLGLILPATVGMV